jgi:hypothetical protein
MPEITPEMITAARKRDHDTRPHGNWSSVSEPQVRRLLEGALAAMEPPSLPDVLPSGPFTGTEEWAVFYGGETPGDCAGFDVVSDEDEAHEQLQWRLAAGVARRSVLYGRWTVLVSPEDELARADAAAVLDDDINEEP